MEFNFTYHGYQIEITQVYGVEFGIEKIIVWEWEEEAGDFTDRSTFRVRGSVDDGEAIKLVMSHIDTSRNEDGDYQGGDYVITGEDGALCFKRVRC